MAASPEHLRLQYGPLERQVKTLLNNDLKEICRSEGLPISGVKAALQARILDQLQNLMNAPDAPRFDELRTAIQAHVRGGAPILNTPNGAMPHNGAYGGRGTLVPSYPGSAAPNQYHPSNGAGPGAFRSNGYHAHQVNGTRLNFKTSPFWTIHEPLSPQVDLPVMGQTRHTAQATVVFPQPMIDRLRNDKSMKVMLFCAVDVPGPSIASDIAFPAQIELKVNGEPFTGNLRGIKKKPGTTKPADITELLRKLPTYNNSVSLTYAATDKKYAFMVYLVKKHSVPELVEKVRYGRTISKETVLKEMNEKAKDEDIETTSTVMSLKCPLSFGRLQVPCRSTICNHNQCFDASSFLETQEQAPQWNCPICNKVFAFRDLVVDKYVQDILDTTSKSTEQVTIEPDGTWKQGSGSEDKVSRNSSTKRKATEAFDFEDLVELPDGRSNGGKTEFSATPFSYMATPSREASTAASTTGRSGSIKRPQAVVDLTLSDDDEPAPRPVKRQSLPAPAMYPDQHQQYPQVRAPSLGNYTSFAIPQHPQNLSPLNPQAYPSNYSPNYPPGTYPGQPAWR